MAGNVRHDWYQTETQIVINILVKNTKNVETKCLEDSLTVEFLTADDERQTFSLNLAHNVVPGSCTHRTMQLKIEVKLSKKEGVRWVTLERVVDLTAAPAAIQDDGPPKYPSSSSKAKDWNLVEAELSKEEEKEKPEGEAALNSLFQKIYSQGTDEVKKAMNKSFSESGGTVLSTNWGEVERDKIDIKAPEGMEWKNWDN